MRKTSEAVIHSFISILLATSLLMVMQMAPIFNAQQPVTIVRAKVFLTGNVNGTLDVTESSNQTGVRFVGQVTGLTPGKHGFHIHQFGDIFSLEQCLSTGAHYNPANASHGAQSSAAGNRHAGDLGNIEANANGVATINIVDRLVSLIPNSQIGNNIIGRGIVVHALEDDLGQGGNSGSATTGNAGSRLACGIIGLVSEEGENHSAAMKDQAEITSMIGVSLFLLAAIRNYL